MAEQVTFKPVEFSELDELATMARTIWNEYWPALIGQEQTDYMVAQFQCKEALERDVRNHNYEYWFLKADDGRSVGYTGGHVEPETNRFFISKIYLLKEERGKGFARRTIEFYAKLAKERGLRALYLTVNKNNVLGVRAYEGTGFIVIDSVETDIGEGFIMDDFIMEKTID